MNSNEEIILSSLCDRIMAACDRLNKRLDVIDEQRHLFTYTDSYAPLQYPAPTYVTSWHKTAETYFYQPLPPPYTQQQSPPSNTYQVEDLWPPDPTPPYSTTESMTPPNAHQFSHLPIEPQPYYQQQYAQPRYSAGGYHPWNPEYQPSRLYSGLDSYARPRYIDYHQLQHEYQPSRPIPSPPLPSHCRSAALLPTIAPPPPLPVTASSVASNPHPRAVVPVSMEKVNSDLGPNLFYPESLTSLNFYTKKICFTENEFDERVTDSKRDSARLSSCGEIKTLHEISECVELDRDDYSSSCFGERRVPEKSHNFDHKRINDDDGEGASFNSSCDSALDADDRLIPPRTSTPDKSLDSTVRSLQMGPFLEQLQSEPVDKIKDRSCYEQPIVVRQPLFRPTSPCCSALTPMATAAVPRPPQQRPRNIVIPFGADFASIHHRSTTLDTDGRLIPPRNDMPCPITYCHKCLLNKYDEEAEVVDALGEWGCPKYIGIWNCIVCIAQKNGIHIDMAMTIGLSSVSAVLLQGDQYLRCDKVDGVFVVQEEEEKSILQKITLQEMMVVMMESGGFKENHKFQKDGVGDGLHDPYVYCHYTFDPGGDTPSKLRFSTLFVKASVLNSLCGVVLPTLRTRWILTAGELIRSYYLIIISLLFSLLVLLKLPESRVSPLCCRLSFA